MARKSLKEIAVADRQVARFLERARAADLTGNVTGVSSEGNRDFSERLSYTQNHLPTARNISPEAQAAISACVLG